VIKERLNVEVKRDIELAPAKINNQVGYNRELKNAA